jgi:hypothetical protein
VIRLLNSIVCALFEMNDLVKANEAFRESSVGGRCSDGGSTTAMAAAWTAATTADGDGGFGRSD